jgi:hypothetical protein
LEIPKNKKNPSPKNPQMPIFKNPQKIPKKSPKRQNKITDRIIISGFEFFCNVIAF